MGSPWRLREGFATSSQALREDVAGAEGFEKRPRSLREAFSKASPIPTEASWSLLEGFARRSWRLRLETIRQIMTSPTCTSQYLSYFATDVRVTGFSVSSTLRDSRRWKLPSDRAGAPSPPDPGRDFENPALFLPEISLSITKIKPFRRFYCID